MAGFDTRNALNLAIRALTDSAIKRAAGGWIPPKERERQQKEAMRAEEKQARQAEKEQKEATRAHEKKQKLLSKQFPTQYMPNVGRQVMNTGGTPDQPQRQLSPMGFYSAAAERAQTLQPSGDAVQMINALKNTQGIKTEELQNAGLIDQSGNVHPDWAGRGKVTREDLVSHLQGQMPQIEETVLGRTIKGQPYPEEYTKMEQAIIDKYKPELDALDKQQFNYSLPQGTRLIAQRKMEELRDKMYAEIDATLPPDREQLLEAAKDTTVPTKYQDYTLPGGKNYREVLLRYAESPEQKLNRAKSLVDPAVWARMTDEQKQQFLSAPDKGIYQSPHWKDPNVLAHIRMADRTGPNGEKILHVEELQSDWGQKGKKEGFANLNAEKEYQAFVNDMRNRVREQSLNESINAGLEPERAKKLIDKIMPTMDADKLAVYLGERDKLNEAFSKYREASKGLPSAPYVTSTEGWTDLALKRVLKEAAEGGYDKVVWTPGAEQAKRYDLSKQIDGLQYVPKTNTLYAYQNGRVVINKTAKPEELEDVVGKDVAKKLLSSKLDDYGVGNLSHYIEGQDLSVGGEGMKGYYDNIVPKRLQNLAKKHDKNARLGYVNLSGIVAPNTELDELSGAINFDRPKKEKPKLQFNLPSLDITPAMRESILRGQSAYKRGGAVSKRHPALSIAGTHIREEEHGEPLFTGRL